MRGIAQLRDWLLDRGRPEQSIDRLYDRKSRRAGYGGPAPSPTDAAPVDVLSNA